ncbi:hypothetical protein EV121DRAFT_296162 [Schizophyllum commune]
MNWRKPAQAGFCPSTWGHINFMTTAEVRMLLRNRLHARLSNRRGSAPNIFPEHGKGDTARSRSKEIEAIQHGGMVSSADYTKRIPVPS